MEKDKSQREVVFSEANEIYRKSLNLIEEGSDKKERKKKEENCKKNFLIYSLYFHIKVNEIYFMYHQTSSQPNLNIAIPSKRFRDYGCFYFLL